MRPTRTLPERLLALALAAITAFSSVPAQALAEAADAAGDAASQEQQVATGNEDAEADSDAAADADVAVADASDGEKTAEAAVDDAAADGDASATSAQAADDDCAVATQSSVTVDSTAILNADGQDLTRGSAAAAKVGDTITFAAYQEAEDYWDDDEELSDYEYSQLSYQWYAGSSKYSTSSYEAIDGATSRSLELTSDLAGKYVFCRYVYGSQSWAHDDTDVLAKAIEAGEDPSISPDAKTLAEAAKKLSTWKPNPAYGTDSNIVSMLEAKLASLGYSNVSASLKAVSFSATDPAAQGGIADDGTITYFFLSNADKTTSSDCSSLRQFKPTYVLSLGTETLEFTPELASTLAWDTAKVESYLDEKIAEAELPASVASGTAESTAKEETLPGAVYVNGKKVATLEWTSSDSSAAKVTPVDYNTVYKVAYTHGGASSSVMLTAKATLFATGFGNAPSTTVSRDFSLTVAPKSAEDIAAEKAELEAALGRIVLKDFATKDEVDPSSVEADLQLPTTRRSGINAPTGAKLSYSSDNDAVAKVNGCRVAITRDIEGGTNEATITATLTKDGVTATRDIKIGIKPIAESEIDEAVAFMQKVKADYANALLGANASVNDVQSDLDKFFEAVPAADGSISYARTMADNTLMGVVAADLPGYDPMSGTTWRTYRSSDTSVVSDESLRVTRPEADSLVTVTSSLTYGKYESLAKAHPENAKLQSLVNQEVKATYRVTGTTSHEDPQISVGFQLVGVAADGTDEVWSDGAQQVVFGSTADRLIEDVLGQLGLKHTSSNGQYGYYLSDITSADGRTLGYDAATGKYWQLFVNGAASDVAASGVALNPGDSVVLYYSAYGASLDDINNATVKASVSFIGPDAAGNNSVWYAASDVRMSKGSTAADLTVSGLKASGLTYTLMTPEESGYFYLSDITSADGRKLGWDQQTGRYWQLYVNGSYSMVGADQVTLKPGDVVQYVYAADGEKPLDGVIVNPVAPRPDWTASWNGFGNAGKTTLTNVPTPPESAEELWKVGLATADDPWVSLGDPIVAGGYVFVTTSTDLIKIDSSGKIVARVSKGGSTAYFSRPVYADGLIISANDDGSLCAFSAQTLECVWKTPALGTPSVGGSYQSNSTMTVANGCVYAEFVAGISQSGTASEGVMRCVDLSDGTVKWDRQTVKSGSSTGEGYYWAGACASGSDLVIADESGYVKLIDGVTGNVKSTASIDGMPCRATVVFAGLQDGKQTYLVVGREPATLFKVVRDGDSLAVTGKCEFGYTSTSTPAIANGRVYVGGNDSSYNGRFTVIDLAKMKVEKSIDMGARAEVKASPIVSVQGDDTYVYFTSNKTPGSLYRFSQKTGEVIEAYTPSGSDAGFCTASVVADEDGNLYYTNDSGTVFALKAAAGYRVDFDSNGGSSVPSAMPVQGKPMAPVADPVRESYKFLGWYTADGTKWDFSQAVAADMTLYAKWERKTVPTPDPDPTPTPEPSPAPNPTPTPEPAPAPKADESKISAAISLRSNTAASDDGEKDAQAQGGATEATAEAASGTSAEATALTSGSAAATSASTDTGAETAAAPAQMPVWPFAGIGLGVLAILLVILLGRRKREDGE